MAKAIAIVPVPSHNQQGAKDELLRKLAAAPVEHAAALMQLYELLEVAHEKQVLEIAHGVLSSTDGIVSRLAHAANSESSINAMRNGLLLVEMAGAMDPEALHRLVKAMPSAIQQGHAEASAAKPPSLWTSLKRLMSEDGRRMLGFGTSVLVALGAALGPKNDASKH
jgi:uncharacterized protein YjgD (DUF1641 family)